MSECIKPWLNSCNKINGATHSSSLYINNNSEKKTKMLHKIIGYKHEIREWAYKNTSETHYAGYMSGLNKSCYRSCATGLSSIVSCMRIKVLLFELVQWAFSCCIRHDAKSSHHLGIHTSLFTSSDSLYFVPSCRSRQTYSLVDE